MPQNTMQTTPVYGTRSKFGNVGFVRTEVRRRLLQWRQVKDCIEGEAMVKSRGVKYLPQPNADDTSPANMARYQAYLTRAVFYNITFRTLAGLIGQLFLREPTYEVPNGLDPVMEDGNGCQLSVAQVAKQAATYVCAFGRAGVLTDYPKTESPASKADIDAGIAQPSISVFAPWDIINWRTMKKGKKEILTLVVLRERYVAQDDGFQIKQASQYRVLRLDAGGYSVEVYRNANPSIWDSNSQGEPEDQPTFGYTPTSIQDGGTYVISEPQFYPTDHNGDPFKEIPFSFIGAENNDCRVDNPPLYDLAVLNIAHYRNSADYEESCFIVGQPTPVLTGLTQQWVETVLKGQVTLGSRSAIALPVGAAAELLQAEPNQMPLEAMRLKQDQMIAIGAKLVEPKQGTRTATEATIDSVSETSILGSIANNVSEAFEKCLVWSAAFSGVPSDSLEFDLNTDFDLANITPQERAQLISEWQNKAITFGEMRANLRQAGVATLDDDEAKTMIDEEEAAEVASIVAKNKLMGLDPSGQVPQTPDPNKAPPGAPAPAPANA